MFSQGGPIFRDRTQAGRELGEHLLSLALENPFVLGLPRGGVVVAAEVARALHAPLDVVVVRKLGAPQDPELGVGAIAPGGVVFLDSSMVDLLKITDKQLAEVQRRESVELERRLKRFQGNRPRPDLRGRTAILVDDGIATGGSARAAARWVRKQQPARAVLAVPVCAQESRELLRDEVDELVTLATPSPFRAVGLWYERFEQTSDEEVIALLEEARRNFA